MPSVIKPHSTRASSFFAARRDTPAAAAGTALGSTHAIGAAERGGKFWSCGSASVLPSGL